jgi:hypothetical protein
MFPGISKVEIEIWQIFRFLYILLIGKSAPCMRGEESYLRMAFSSLFESDQIAAPGVSQYRGIVITGKDINRIVCPVIL